jgi:hypothetical protein
VAYRAPCLTAGVGITAAAASPAWYPSEMDTPTRRDLSRPAATSDDTEFSLSIEEAADRYAKAGHPRTIRTLQRYCEKGHLECRKDETPFGDKYRITPQSVARDIAQIEELRPGDTVAEQPRPQMETPAPTGSDMPRQAATVAEESSQYVVRLEREVEQLHDDRDFLREQIKTKRRADCGTPRARSRNEYPRWQSPKDASTAARRTAERIRSGRRPT